VLAELRGFVRYLLTGETGHGKLPLLPPGWLPRPALKRFERTTDND
jgi:hypothetical protein